MPTEATRHWPALVLRIDPAEGGSLERIGHLEQRHPARSLLLPVDPDARLDVRLWDRVCNLYVMLPMQAAVAAKLSGDPVQAARTAAVSAAQLELAYGVLGQRLQGRLWLCVDLLSLADCATTPALSTRRRYGR